MTDFVISPRITFCKDMESIHRPRQGAQRPHHQKVMRGRCRTPRQ